MTPSAIWLISFACCGVDIPKPIAHGTDVFSFTIFTMESRSVVISLLVPVTPRLDTIYKNPFASFAIIAMRSSEVGAMRDIRSTLCLSATSRNSFFSSKGISGSMIPSMPTSLHLVKNFSAPYENTTLA